MEVSLKAEDNRQIGFFGRLGGLFTSPGEVFSVLKEKTDFWWPVIFILVSAGLSYPISRVNMQLMADSSQYAEVAGVFEEPNLFVIIFSLIGALVTFLLAWLVRTGVFTLAAKALGGDSVSFATVFSVLGYTNLPQTLRLAFQGISAMVYGIVPPVGMEMGMELYQRSTPLGIVLTEINPFTAFYLILTTLALERLFKLSRGKALLITFLSWAVVIGISLISTRFAPSLT